MCRRRVELERAVADRLQPARRLQDAAEREEMRLHDARASAPSRATAIASSISSAEDFRLRISFSVLALVSSACSEAPTPQTLA